MAEAIYAEIDRVRAEGVDSADFERVKKSYYGRYLMAFNSVESIADQLVECAYTGHGLFDDVEVYRTVTLQDLNKRLQNQMKREHSSLSVIRPAQGE